MRKQHLPAPGVFYGNYPENVKKQITFFSKLKKVLTMPFVLFTRSKSKQYGPFIDRVHAYEKRLALLPEAQLQTRTSELRAQLSFHGLTEPLIAEVFALVSHVSTQTLGIKPYQTQLTAARIMLDGKLAEMATGEGKTLTASICAATAALAGIPVHIITSNDYLVERDAETLSPLYHALGLTVGTVTQPLDAQARKTAYACNITYTTAKELVFDYLKDQSSRGLAKSSLQDNVNSLSGQSPHTLLRGLCMAIIDEADSIMIDEARVPLILSKAIENDLESDYYKKAVTLSFLLKKEQDFVLNLQQMSATLTDSGRNKIKSATQALSGVWQNSLHREELIGQALAAKHLYQRDHQYLVKEGKVHIIDEITGRVAAGRVWSRGLHQMIEIKEGCKPSSELMTVAQITYQRFFPRYLKLGGMSGTLNESRAELFSIYGLRINQVALNKTSQRTTLPTVIYPSKQTLLDAVIVRTKATHQTGRPILIGTDSVADSELLSQQLQQSGLVHQVLNARQDQQEADIIANAGQKNQITISTNMAGRGTDITIDKTVAALGGLHLISCQHNPSRRIDRQLIGRCARQGQPGTTETLLSTDKPLIKKIIPKFLIARIKADGLSKPTWLVLFITRLPQWLEESNQYKKRHAMMKRDARFEKETLMPE